MAASAAGLAGISQAGAHPNLVWLAAAMLLQGIGLGVFQVAYFDIITAAIPPRQRGVAGALGMATRTLGMVTGATVLMLVFQAARGTDTSTGALVTAFQITFAAAAAIPAGLVLLDALWVRRPPAAPK
jgi:MFS family permease